MNLVDEVRKNLNKKATIRVGKLIINVTVVDVAYRYGKIRYGVTPECGSGISYFEYIYDVKD